MKFNQLDHGKIVAAATKKFPGKYIEVDETDFYVNDIFEGKILIDGIDHPFYVSTNYVYEDHIVNGNSTRYKVALKLIYVKEDRYEIVYDSYGKSYVVVEEEDTLEFLPYEDFYEYIKKQITLCEKE